MFNIIGNHQGNEVHFKYDEASGLKAIVAIHNTKFGPALGGCRFLEYESEEKALTDALRLSKGMSYKAALSNIAQGGGKSVIIKPKNYDSTKLFEAFGQFIEDLGGRYITAIDSGTTAKEMDIIATKTSHVTSTSTETNPSDYTARGVYCGIISACNLHLYKSSLEGVHVAIQGLGNVGFQLAEMLFRAGARLTVADINQDRVGAAVDLFKANAVPADKIYSVECDVFAPCGLGGIINDETIPALRCKIVAGSANNQLQTTEHGVILHQKNILYAPDYVINAGGLIYASMHHTGETDVAIKEKASQISSTLDEIFTKSLNDNLPTSEVADHIAEARLSDSGEG